MGQKLSTADPAEGGEAPTGPLSPCDGMPAEAATSASEAAPPRRAWPIGRRVGVALAVAAGLALPLIIWRDQILFLFAAPQHLVEMIRHAGPWAPLALMALYAVQTIVAPIPGNALNFAAGYLFGLPLGVLYSWIGLVAGTILALVLARYGGRPLVGRLIGAAALEKMDRLAEGRGLGFFFLVFLLPGLPDDVACLVAGMTGLPLPALIAASALGRLPSLVASVWLGACAERLPWQGWLILGGLASVVAVVVWRHGAQIRDLLLGRPARRPGAD